MTIFDMLGQSGVLTLLGMAVVFLFLIILVISVTLTGKLIRGIVPQEEETAAVPLPGGTPRKAVNAAISAALTEYRKDNA
ncbi:MAG: OadG family protein [Spirochaetaceae bacterium]|jgi:oxaloacetate decarboxylase gamma subunit|nr:OadG family protein [Spirochaetaceae bacterium]